MPRIEPLSKNKIKWLQSLSKKKERECSGLFFAEGTKIVEDLQKGFSLTTMVATQEYYDQHSLSNAQATGSSNGRGLGKDEGTDYFLATDEDLKRISAQCTPQSVFAVFRKRECAIDEKLLRNSLSLALDTVQDPGNMGTIIRIADWFGIEQVFCSHETADLYNPKVVQATMGALARVKVFYVDLNEFLDQLKKTAPNEGEYLPIFGTFLDGDTIYGKTLPDKGIIVMGNEGNGISNDVAERVSDRLYIPNFPTARATSESLNVAVATAIVCSEFRRANFPHKQQ